MCIDAVMGELGRYPVYNEVPGNILKYCHYIINQETRSLIHEAVICNVNLANSVVCKWYICINQLKEELKLNDMYSVIGEALAREEKVESFRTRPEPKARLRTYNY